MLGFLDGPRVRFPPPPPLISFYITGIEDNNVNLNCHQTVANNLMTEKEAKEYLLDHLEVTPQKIIIAKLYLLKQFNKNALSQETFQLIDNFLVSVDAKKPTEIHFKLDTEAGLSQAVEYSSWRLSACEAMWSLISETLFVTHSNHMYEDKINIPYTTGSTKGGIRLDEVSIYLPSQIRAAMSGLDAKQQILTDGDLFLHEMGIPNMDAEVEKSLREAIKCFRHELFTACLAMMGRAMEGAWIELGLSLGKTIPPHMSKRSEKINNLMTDPFFGIAKKIHEILKLCEEKYLFAPLSGKSGIKFQDLRSCAIWADAVRESRNSVHYGVETALPNSYEKVAALLIGAAPHFKVLYALISACDL
jgi:hypothetical protein